MMPNKATSSSFQNHDDHQVVHQHHHHHHMLPPSSSSSTLLYYYLSILKEKLSEVQTLVGVLASPQDSTTSMVISTMISTIQEIIVAATSMRSSLTTTTSQQTIPLIASTQQQQGTNNNIGHSNFLSEAEELDWFSESYNSTNTNTNNNIGVVISDEVLLARGKQSNDDIIELDAADLLARYTHFCQVCGKGFKRDANLRMHMRAHGDEYKTNAALKNNNERLLRNNNNSKKYSCPEEGCRWNKKHERFQPLKSMICVKNHYKRSHCPKMYVCKRCNMKQFSVLSDLRTHEKHCGHPKWHCSCGTTFSRKDKLLGHLALFLGHVPATTSAASSHHHL